jgi:RNA polymerase sigma-70 factor
MESFAKDQMNDLSLSARAAWPGVEVPQETFAQYLAARGGDEVGHPADLYLACACIHRVPRALETFEQKFMSRVPEFVARMKLSPETYDDLCQRIRERVLLPVGEQPPRMSEYSGRGPLLGWLRVVAMRLAIDLIRQRAPAEQLDSDDRLLGTGGDPELQYLKQRYQSEFREALRSGLQKLSAERRNVLRLYFVDRLTLLEIGALYRVGKSTVFRWIAGAQEQLLTEARRFLRERLGLSPAEFDSLANAVRSQLDFSLPALLRTHPEPP